MHRSIIAAPPSHAFHTSTHRFGLEEFFLNSRATSAGRCWSVDECRLKSAADLHRLWFVCLKERNMLLTYQRQCHLNTIDMEHPERLLKVKQSMTAIKTVLGERSLEYRLQMAEPVWMSKRIDKITRRRQHTKRHAIAKRARYVQLQQKDYRVNERKHGRKKLAWALRGRRPIRRDESGNVVVEQAAEQQQQQ